MPYKIVNSRIFGLAITFSISFWKMLCQIKRIKPDVIFGVMLDQGVLSAIFGWLFNAISITQAQGSDVDEVKGLLRRFDTWFSIKFNNIVTATNGDFINKMKKRVPGKKMKILQNVLDSSLVESPTDAIKLNDYKLNLLSIGRLLKVNGIETKGISYAIRALRELPECYLHILGDGPMKNELERLAKEYLVDNRVKFYGNISRDKVMKMMLSCDVLVFPSLTEGLSMTVVEALMVGLPIVTTHIGGQKEFLKDMETVLFIQKANEVDIIRAIKTILNDMFLLAELRKNGKILFNKYFTLNAFANRFNALIREFKGDLIT